MSEPFSVQIRCRLEYDCYLTARSFIYDEAPEVLDNYSCVIEDPRRHLDSGQFDRSLPPTHLTVRCLGTRRSWDDVVGRFFGRNFKAARERQADMPPKELVELARSYLTLLASKKQEIVGLDSGCPELPLPQTAYQVPAAEIRSLIAALSRLELIELSNDLSDAWVDFRSAKSDYFFGCREVDLPEGHQPSKPIGP